MSIRAALTVYVKNVRKPGDHLVLIHVPEYDNAIKDSSWLTDPEIVAELLKDTEERSQDLVNAYKTKMKELQIEGNVSQSCYGKPGESIIQAVKDEGANILILGTRGRGFIRRTFLGSIHESAEIMTSQRTVAIAIDDSDHSSLAFDFYVKNVRKPSDHLVLIHVPEYDNAIKDCSWLTDREIVAELLKDTEERSQELVNAYQMKMRELQIEGIVRQSCFGKPGESIIQTMKEEEANLLILGTRGRGLIRRTFLGSVSDYCLHHCRVPVIICRHKTIKHSMEHTNI